MPKTKTSASNIAASSTNKSNVSAPTIDIEQLVTKVYQLMVEDVRLARARGDIYRARK